jgi:hypothetical protein
VAVDCQFLAAHAAYGFEADDVVAAAVQWVSEWHWAPPRAPACDCCVTYSMLIAAHVLPAVVM